MWKTGGTPLGRSQIVLAALPVFVVIQKPRTSAHHNAPHSCYPDPEPTPQQLIGGIMAQNNIWPRHRQTRRPSTLNPNVAKAFALGTDAITDGRERANRPKNFPRLYPAITSLSHPSPMLWGGILSTRNGMGLAFVLAVPNVFQARESSPLNALPLP